LDSKEHKTVIELLIMMYGRKPSQLNNPDLSLPRSIDFLGGKIKEKRGKRKERI
jgi:hypothetical protein